MIRTRIGVLLLLLLSACASRHEIEGLLQDSREMRAGLERIEQRQAAQDSLLLDRVEYLKERIREGETIQRTMKADQISTGEELRELIVTMQRTLVEGQDFNRRLATKIEELNVLLAQSGLRQERDSLAGADPDWLYNQGTLDLYRGFPELARLSFREYLARFPGAEHEEDVRYWLAETFLSEQQPDSALRVLEDFLTRYPGSAKEPAAMSRKAMLLAARGEEQQAQELFLAVMRNWPQSPEAEIARQRLAEGSVKPGEEVKKKGLERNTDGE